MPNQPAVQIAIPSYKRYEVCRDKTLATLKRHNADFDRVTVFVANEKELDLYKKTLGNTVRIVVGQEGLLRCRKWYHTQYWPDGTRILSMDDDIEKIQSVGLDGKLHELACDLDTLCDTGFYFCKKHRTKLWGIYPAANAFYMDAKVVVGLRYIIGCFFGSYAGAAIWRDERGFEESDAEDFQTTLAAFKRYGNVVRQDYCTVTTKYFAEGGIAAEANDNGEERAPRHESALRAIVKANPSLATLKIKAGGVPNIRLKSLTNMTYQGFVNR